MRNNSNHDSNFRQFYKYYIESFNVLKSSNYCEVLLFELYDLLYCYMSNALDIEMYEISMLNLETLVYQFVLCFSHQIRLQNLVVLVEELRHP